MILFSPTVELFPPLLHISGRFRPWSLTKKKENNIIVEKVIDCYWSHLIIIIFTWKQPLKIYFYVKFKNSLFAFFVFIYSLQNDKYFILHLKIVKRLWKWNMLRYYFVWNVFCIPESFNENISHYFFLQKIIFVYSQH